MVEINTVFQQLVSVLSHIDPPKLNESLGALAQAFSGRGPQLGQSLSDLDSFLARLEPSLPAFSHDLAVLPAVSNAYADAAPDLVEDRGQRDPDQQDDRRRAAQPRCVADQRDRLGRHRQRRLVGEPPTADECAASAGADHRSDQRVRHQALTCGFRWPRTDWARCAVVGTEHQHIGESHAWAPNVIGIRRTCPRLRRRAARGAWVCRSCRSTRTRRNWLPISAPTRWGTETHRY